MIALLISTYEMGRQPFGLASPAAWLRAAGWTVDCLDLAKERWRDEAAASADLVGFYLPMHTATRLAAPVIRKVRGLNPSARICAYGLYGPLNTQWLRSLGVDDVLGGEFEGELASIAQDLSTTRDTEVRSSQVCSPVSPVSSVVDSFTAPPLPRLRFLVPDRRGLPPLDRYATLQHADGTRTLVGFTEASRGCRHLCRHCPIVPVYNGQFRVVQPHIVLADIANQVAAGARHITFGDPDFFNGPAHACRVVDLLHAVHPGITYDVTIKVEHLLHHRELLPRLRETGCLFITSAVESIDDRVLARLDKGHTRQDFVDAVALCREAGVTLMPTFVAFHPWTTLEDYCEMLDTIDALDLIEHVAPIQLAIRLLIPEGSRLLELGDVRSLVGPFDPATLTYRWSHADPRVDRLQQDLSELVGVKLTKDRSVMFEAISALAHECAGRAVPFAPRRAARDRATVPYLNEPWYC
jgi:radical SAM superfamily enzyme YgiQ (UPF0313 family)